MWLFLLLACMHHVRLTSEPAGAFVYVDGERVGSTPMMLEVAPAQNPDVRVWLPGYRSLTFEAGKRVSFWSFVGEAVTLRWGKLRGERRYGSWNVLLVPEHGPVGTWSPEDVP